MIVKNTWDSLRRKFQLKQISKSREKNIATNENCILRRMGLKFQNLTFNPMQNSPLEQAKVDHDIRQIWLSTQKKR